MWRSGAAWKMAWSVSLVSSWLRPDIAAGRDTDASRRRMDSLTRPTLCERDAYAQCSSLPLRRSQRQR